MIGIIDLWLRGHACERSSGKGDGSRKTSGLEILSVLVEVDFLNTYLIYVCVSKSEGLVGVLSGVVGQLLNLVAVVEEGAAAFVGCTYDVGGAEFAEQRRA